MIDLSRYSDEHLERVVRRYGKYDAASFVILPDVPSDPPTGLRARKMLAIPKCHAVAEFVVFYETRKRRFKATHGITDTDFETHHWQVLFAIEHPEAHR